MTVDVHTTLSDLVTADPRRARVLEGFGIDYCCHGQRPLEQATAETGLDSAEVAKALDLADPPPTSGPAGNGAQPAANTALANTALANTALAHDIVDTHHAYLWDEMPRLQALVAKVHTVHGERHPELAQVHAVFEQAVGDLEPHMTREERVVFPAIARIEKTQAPAPSGPLAEPIARLRAEHEVVGERFVTLRTLTGGYAAPDDACNSYRMMLKRLEEMEFDLHEHVHKENNILFPHALELERRVTTA